MRSALALRALVGLARAAGLAVRAELVVATLPVFPAATFGSCAELSERGCPLFVAATLAPRHAGRGVIRFLARGRHGLRFARERPQDRRIEIGAGFCHELLAQLFAQGCALDLLQFALGQVAELERAVGNPDQPRDVEA